MNTEQMNEARVFLEWGNKYPYDAPDKWWKNEDKCLDSLNVNWTYKAARGIIANIRSRTVIKEGFDEIEEGIRVEIMNVIAEIIQLAYDERNKNILKK